MKKAKKPHLVVQRDPTRYSFAITKKMPPHGGRVLFTTRCIVAATEYRLACREVRDAWGQAMNRWNRIGHRLASVKVAPAFKDYYEAECKKHRESKPVLTFPDPLHPRFQPQSTESAT